MLTSKKLIDFNINSMILITEDKNHLLIFWQLWGDGMDKLYCSVNKLYCCSLNYEYG